MKTIITTMITICLALTGLMAQTQPPQPPKPGSNSVSVHSDETKSSSSYSYDLKDDNGESKGSTQGNVSISSSSSDDSYSFRLRYNGSKDDQIKTLLYKELGTNNLKESNGKYVWLTNSGGEEVYEIKFSNGKLTMDVDKTIASQSITDKIVNLGKSVRTLISGQKEEEIKAQRLQREANRLQRDANRMRREAVRLQEQAQQRNVDRIKLEADRLARQAERAGVNASRSGGVSSVVTQLLQDDKTRYNGIDNGTAWVLPKLLPLMRKQLLKDGLIQSIDDNINILKEENGMYVNGTRISKISLQIEKYNTIFKSMDLRDDYSFSLNMAYDHLVIIDDTANIDNVLFTLRTLNLIPEEDEKLVLELNGSSVIKNGTSLSAQEVKVFNKVLLGQNVIPAPGKTLIINGEDNYSLGYSLNNGKTHLGLWQMGR